MSGYKATRETIGNMAKSLERDPQLESIPPTARETSVSRSNQAASSGWNLPSITASTSAEAGASDFNPTYFPPPVRNAKTKRKTLLRARILVERPLRCGWRRRQLPQ
jgi:hypothetical protein